MTLRETTPFSCRAASEHLCGVEKWSSHLPHKQEIGGSSPLPAILITGSSESTVVWKQFLRLKAGDVIRHPSGARVVLPARRFRAFFPARVICADGAEIFWNGSVGAPPLPEWDVERRPDAVS